MKLNFCPECAHPLQKISNTKYVCAKGHPYWNSGRAAATVVLLRNRQALFSKRASEPKKGYYHFPGGFVDFGENAYEAIERELKEETGLTAHRLTFIDSTLQFYEENVTVCDVIFATQYWQGTLQAADDVAALGWWSLEFVNSASFAWEYPKLVAKL